MPDEANSMSFAINDRSVGPEVTAGIPEYSDESLALRFSTQYGNKLRYVSAWGQWLIWDGTVWRPDDTLQAEDLARMICREAAAECDGRVASAIASAKTIRAVERLARADRAHASTATMWDANPWLLNTGDGVVDLRTGNIRAHKENDFFTKVTAR